MKNDENSSVNEDENLQSEDNNISRSECPQFSSRNYLDKSHPLQKFQEAVRTDEQYRRLLEAKDFNGAEKRLEEFRKETGFLDYLIHLNRETLLPSGASTINTP